MSVYRFDGALGQLDLTLFKYYLAIASFGGLTKASQAIGVSQPTLSLALKKLEKNIGTTLVDRTSKKFELTHDGQTLLSFCQNLENGIEGLMEALSKRAHPMSKRLRLGTATSVGLCMIEELCEKLTKSDEGVDLNIETSSPHHIIEQLNNGSLDAALMRDDVYDSRLSFFTVHKDELTFVLSKDLLSLKKGFPIKITLKQLPLITFPIESPIRSKISKICRKEELQFKSIYETDSVETLIHLVRGGIGPSFLLKSWIEKDLKQGLLIEPDISFPRYKSAVALVTPISERGRTTQEWLRELLLN